LAFATAPVETPLWLAATFPADARVLTLEPLEALELPFDPRSATLSCLPFSCPFKEEKCVSPHTPGPRTRRRIASNLKLAGGRGEGFMVSVSTGNWEILEILHEIERGQRGRNHAQIKHSQQAVATNLETYLVIFYDKIPSSL
jgi:hypothetical protein